MNCPYKAYFASLVQQATFTDKLNSSFDKEITMTTNNKTVQRHRPVTNKTGREVNGGANACIVVVVVVVDDPASSPCQNRILVQRGRDQQSPVLVHPNLVAEPPSERSNTPHHKYGPPRPPIRMASYDSSTTNHDDEWSSDEEDPKNDPVFQSLGTNKLDSTFVSTEHRHFPGVRRSASAPPSGHNNNNNKNDQQGRLSPRESGDAFDIARSDCSGFQNASRWGTSAPPNSFPPVVVRVGTLPKGRRSTCC